MDGEKINCTVEERLPELKYIVKLPNGKLTRAYSSGKMRQNHIQCIIGDRVQILYHTEGESRVILRLK